MDYNMKTIFVIMFLCVLGAECVINQPIQDAQRREAPGGFNEQGPPPPNSPHKEYGVPVLRFGPPKVNVEHGPPNQRPQQQQQQQQQQRPQLNQRQQQMLQALQGQRQNRFQQLQRIMGALRTGSGVSSQGRVVNRPRPQQIPIAPQQQQQQHQHQHQQQQQGYNPQQNYGPPQQNNQQGPPKIQYGAPASSSSGSLASFVQNHNPDVKCDGWIPIFPASGNGNSIDGGYQSNGNSQHSHGESHGSSNGGYQSQGQSHGESHGHSGGGGQSHHSHEESHGNSGNAGYQSQGQSHHSHGESHGNSGNAGYQSQGQSYHSHGESHGSGHQESHHSNGGSADNVNIIESYGLPNHGSGGHSPSAHQLQQFPDFKNGGSAGGINLPENSYGPPDHSHGGSAGGINLPEESYGPPNHNNAGAGGIITLPDHSHSHGEGSLSNANIVVEQSVDFGPPESSYGPPPSGTAHLESHHENHENSHSESHGHAGGIQSIQSVGVELQLPQVDSGSHFSNDLGLISSAISSGQSELVQSHAVHESHTSELTNNFIGGGSASNFQQSGHNNNGGGQFQQTGGLGSYATVGSGSASNFGSTGGDSYSSPPLDSYAPGKYNPSFLNKRPAQGQQQQQPQQPPKLFLPQRPILLQPPAPQYIPPIPIKMLRPRPQQYQGQAHSIAQGYAANSGSQGYASNSGSQQSHSSSQGYASSSGSQQAHSHQSIGGHSQHIQHGPPPPQQQIRQQPRHPLAYRMPVPQGLLESIGQQVQALDNGNHIQQSGSTYLPPPTGDLPFNNQGPQQFHAQQQGSSASGYSTQSQSSHQQQQQQQSSSGAYAYQNEVRNYPTHDCGKGPQFNQVQVPHQEYGPPADSINLRHTNVISEALEIPNHSSADFNSASSYGPPASGPALLDNVGYESQVRSNSGSSSSSETQIIQSTGSESHSSSSQQHNEQLPGLNTGLSGLDFISAQKSQSLQIPVQGALGSYQLQFQSSSGNSIDGPNHQQILSDGLLNSILSAIEQPNQQIPQVTEDQQTDHSEVQVFLKSPAGQDVIADKVPEAAVNESEEPAADVSST
ncbi:unnamed protein product [Diamesa serratosioi]